MPIEARHSRVAALILIPLLVALAILFRSPFLLNPAILNSDAAIVGLQGRHILAGEWSPFLWGAGYQASFEPTVAALIFKFLGPTPLALMWVPLSGFLVLLSLAYLILCRNVGWLKALVLSSLFVICPPIVNHNTIMSTRQWCITFVFLSFFLLSCAAESKKSRIFFFWGTFSVFFAAYLDFFALQFLPGALVFGWLAAQGTDHTDFFVRRDKRAAFGLGIVAGVIFIAATRLASPSAGSAASFSFKMVAQNWPLLWKTCLPIAIGTEFFVPGGKIYSQVFNPSLRIQVVQSLGTASLILALLLSWFFLFYFKV
jgi:hypothetical protein